MGSALLFHTAYLCIANALDFSPGEEGTLPLILQEFLGDKESVLRLGPANRW